MSSPDFYERLPILTDFTSVTDPNHYHSIPDDWWIVVADVRRSTQAIEQGLYKAVNILGASVIIGVLNLAKPTAVPFVFGGDGAAVCLPPHLATAVPDTLRTIRSLAHEMYGLDLRVGVVPVSVIQAAGYGVRVARVRVSDYYVQAAFSGGGLTYAETLLGLFMVRFGIKAFGTDWGRYKEDVMASSDVRKFDDMIRQILSGTAAQRAALTGYLDEHQRQDRLAYGLNVAEAALMTCVIVERTSEHFHLIDGANGGYAKAAQQLKRQLVGSGQ